MPDVYAGAKVYRNTAVTAKVEALAFGRNVYGAHVQNPNASDAWVQFYDALSANVTVGTTTPKLSLYVPASGAYDSLHTAFPVNFETAVTIATTTTVGGGTAPGAGLVVQFLYK